MSTAVASAATLTPSLGERHVSPRHFAAIAPSTLAVSAPPSSAEPAPKRARSNATPENTATIDRSNSSGKPSPTSHRNGVPPMINIKKEPGSPAMQSSRPRPKRLDLSSSMANSNGPQTARPSAPLTSRESAGLAIQDVGLACLSPGFQTSDPGMREQLQRSLNVRDRQRQIIEARQKGQKPGSSHDNTSSGDSSRPQDTTLFGVQTRTPTTSRRKGPPPGLSINAPSASAFANDRVIQSAPMHQTFTGLRPGEHPFSRHSQLGPSGLSQTSHIHHIPATQTNNRLPPIADVFANDRLDAPRNSFANPHSPSHSSVPPPLPSPGFAPQHQQQQHGPPPLSARTREFRSAEEAMHSLSGGRDELLPKVVHYGGVQPPTPPSPMPPSGINSSHYPHHPHPQQPSSTVAAAAAQTLPPPPLPHQLHTNHQDSSSTTTASNRPDILSRTSSMSGSRRRTRDEYERDNGSSPPLPLPPSSFTHNSSHSHPHASREPHKRPATTFARVAGGGGGEDDMGQQREDLDWRAALSGTEKREEFLRLCERAWDLFHS